jgi:DNA-binding NarL/FixJ family response regulator
MFTTLIVEDNSTFRQSLKDMLRERYPIMKFGEASDGAEALQIIKTLLPDLIFMGIRLPGENGLEITRKIKRDYPQARVIILANYDLAEYRDAAYRYGADFFLPKNSSTWEEITALVESIFSKTCTSAPGVGTEDC